MAHVARRIAFLGSGDRLKHYGIAVGDGDPRAPLVTATRKLATTTIPSGAYGFTIAHDGASSGMGLVYWWANENELHHSTFLSPHDDPGALEPHDSTAMACVWELEVIDFERKAWLHDVLKDGAHQRYLERRLTTVNL